MVEKAIRAGVCHSIHQYTKSNNKYIKHYDKNNESSYVKYQDANNLYSWAISEKLPVNDFKWVKVFSEYNKIFIRSHNEESDEKYFIEVDIQYLENVHIIHKNLPFLPKRMKIDKVEKLAANLHDKTEYVTHIRNLKF